MSDNTKIEWADATINAVNGCSVVSPGCTNCYAMAAGARNLPGHPSTGLTKQINGKHVWTGEVRLSETALLQPLKWKRPRRIFWNAHGDLFHEKVPDEWIDRVFAVCALTPQHTHMILTKRSARMREYFASDHHYAPPVGALADLYTAYPEIATRTPLTAERAMAVGMAGWPLPNVWLGVSVEDQTRADERIPDLLATPAAVRFISAEPLLAPVDLSSLMFVDEECPNWEMEGSTPPTDPETGCQECCKSCDWTGTVSVPKLDWVICGGESGPGARPMHPDWARSLRDQCAAADVAFHFKQWGEWAPWVGAVDGWTIPDNPEISRYEWRDWEGDCWGKPYTKGWMDEVDDDTVSRIGKKHAGRLLDGRTHDEFPA